MHQLLRAMDEAFDKHEAHREMLRRVREAHKEARDADERVRQLRRLLRARKGRAA